MRERDIQARVVGHARHRGVIARKLDFGEGWPDYMFLSDGEVLFIEFKGLGGRISPLQAHIHDMLRRAKFTVHVVDDVAQGTLALEEWIEDVRPMSPTGNPVVDYMDITKALVRSKKP